MDWSGIRYFTAAELACRCGCGRADMDPGFMAWLDGVRRDCGFPLAVSSGFRCERHNTRLGGGWAHPAGVAVDIRADRAAALTLIGVACRHNVAGLGVAQQGEGRFIHLDRYPGSARAPRPTVWSY